MEHKNLKKTIETFFNIEDIFVKSRKRNIIEARGYFNKILYDSGMTQQQVSDVSKMDRVTILYSINAINDLIETYKQYRDQYEEIVAALNDKDFTMRTIEFRGIITSKKSIVEIDKEVCNWFLKHY
jgi:hypothetical protein